MYGESPVQKNLFLAALLTGVFPDSKVSVKIGYSNYQFDFSQLARTR